MPAERNEDEPVEVWGRNGEALEKAIDALEGLGDEHAAIVEHARTLARLIDRYGATDTKLHGEYRQVLKTLMDLGRAEDVDAFQKVIEMIRGN